MMRSVYIVDDDDPVRLSLQTLLQHLPGLIVRGFPSGDAFLAAIDPVDRGVVLLDFHMPGATGLDVLRTLRAKSECFATVMLTGRGDVAIAVQAMKAGAFDFLEKPYDPDRLIDVVEAAFSRFEQDSARSAQVESARARIASLSPREREVLLGLIEGRANKVIAHDLDLSPRTVEIYRANMMEKLAVGSLSEALRLAFAAGLVEPA
ncbi:response regulator transcription factor [Sphingomonas sp. PAMC 26617]|uniref:response regulator transcription factor n=1 Tax=Sphingomonas sp. PAMC 26617 TaxID=1112216 RepID=UPI000288C729|nr:response regulator [Sphingomonas sp. PAMC 26617]